MKFKLILLGLIIGFSASGQEAVKGLVYDKTGPMPGVLVTEIGTDNKVMTDAQGQFEIKTKRTNPTLTFTFIGFHSRTIKIRNSKFLKVKMKWDRPKYKHISRSNEPPTMYSPWPGMSQISVRFLNLAWFRGTAPPLALLAFRFAAFAKQLLSGHGLYTKRCLQALVTR